MTTAYDLYGARDIDISLAREYLEGALGIVLEERESSYQGGIYYVCGTNDSENFVLKINVDPFDGGAVEQNFPDYPVLLYINATARSIDLEAVIRKEGYFDFLRHEFF